MKNLAAALVAFQGECPTISKDSKNPFFNSKYASMDAIHSAVQPLLLKHGLAVMQFPVNGEGTSGVVTRVIHESGESIEYPFLVPYAKSDPQGACAAVTYARRYGISGALGLVTDDDDDGNAASGNVNLPSNPPAKRKPSPKVGKDAFIGKEEREKLRVAAEKRLEWLGMPAGKQDVLTLLQGVLKDNGFSSTAEMKQPDFEKVFVAIQGWE